MGEKRGFELGNASEIEIGSKKEEERKKELDQLKKEVTNFFKEPTVDEYYSFKSSLKEGNIFPSVQEEEKYVQDLNIIKELLEKLKLPTYHTGSQLEGYSGDSHWNASVEVNAGKINYKKEGKYGGTPFGHADDSEEVNINQETPFVPFVELYEEGSGILEDGAKINLFFTPEEKFETGWCPEENGLLVYPEEDEEDYIIYKNELKKKKIRDIKEILFNETLKNECIF